MHPTHRISTTLNGPVSLPQYCYPFFRSHGTQEDNQLRPQRSQLLPACQGDRQKPIFSLATRSVTLGTRKRHDYWLVGLPSGSKSPLYLQAARVPASACTALLSRSIKKFTTIICQQFVLPQGPATLITERCFQESTVQ